MFIRRDEAEKFIEEVRGDDPDLASQLRIEERELRAEAKRCSALDGRLRGDLTSLPCIAVSSVFHESWAPEARMSDASWP